MHCQSNKIERVCLMCGSAFCARRRSVALGEGKYCSRDCAIQALRGNQVARFHGNIYRSAGADSCWPWIGPTDKACGRGRTKFNGRLRYAQHVAWEIANNRDLPRHADIEVLCGSLLCCNPEHLRWLASDDPERFWLMVDRSGGNDACWPWMGGLNEYGYGWFYIFGKTMAAHRHAWRLTNGDPGEMCVCHACDNRKCCNPGHHWLGTSEENTADRHTKGRSVAPYEPNPPRGERQAHAKLTEGDVRDIRVDYAKGNIRLATLAARYGVTPENISAIVNRKTWKHI